MIWLTLNIIKTDLKYFCNSMSKVVNSNLLSAHCGNLIHPAIHQQIFYFLLVLKGMNALIVLVSSMVFKEAETILCSYFIFSILYLIVKTCLSAIHFSKSTSYCSKKSQWNSSPKTINQAPST